MGVIENVNKVMEDGECGITQGEGEVLFLDFWATWCPPCQAPMAHNHKMLEENKEKWGGKVRIIGLSIDNDAATVKNHINTKGWTNVEHYHVRNGKCTADKEFGVQGVPHTALVDTNGISYSWDTQLHDPILFKILTTFWLEKQSLEQALLQEGVTTMKSSRKTCREMLLKLQ